MTQSTLDNRQLKTPRGFSRTLEFALGNLANTGRARKQLMSVFFDALIALTSLWLAYSLRHGQAFSDFRSTWHLFALTPIVTILVFGSLGIYRWVIRSANERLLTQLVKGCVLVSLAMIMVVYFIPPDRANPRSLFVIFALLLFTATFGARLVWRGLLHDFNTGEPIAIFGAGKSGQQLAALLRSGREYNPTVFIDDDSRVTRNLVMGLTVLDGQTEELAQRLKRYEVSRIVLAMPSITGSDYRKKLERVKSLGLPVQTMPSITELMTRQARPDQIRDISIRDILGRTEVPPDMDLMAKRVRDKTVMVTGGGGSIGSELCRQIARLDPAKLIVLDNSEANLYQITEELTPLSVEFGFEFEPILGSVTDEVMVEHVFTAHQVDTVYHAAAYKHVPIIERQPEQGVRVNIFGTQTVLDAAINSAVSDFVLVSTDKAVRPTNAMGATKRLAELVLQSRAAETESTRISMVRFGNVLGSSGSVVPKFKKQIMAGGPITLTHPDITRYFMTIPEASQLVLQASAIATGGEVFVLDMGEPVRIQELAETMVRLYGKTLRNESEGDESGIEIIYTGLRPGEKMYEELFLSDDYACTRVPKIFAAEEFYLESNDLAAKLEQLDRLCESRNDNEIRKYLIKMATFRDARTTSGESLVVDEPTVSSEDLALPA